MNRIEHLIEPSRLLLIWQRALHGQQRRDRRIVGEIRREPNGEAVFRYLVGTPDFAAALSEGFVGYPAFRYSSDQPSPDSYRSNVLYAFTSRMASRKRGDFGNYLAAHFLPDGFSGSDFSLLAHTGARLPGDGFEVMADLSTIQEPFDLLVEVAGTRHQPTLDLDRIAAGDPVRLALEPENRFDPTAIAVSHEMGQLGYLPRPYCAMLQERVDEGQATATVAKLNGRPERRLVYVMLRVRAKVGNTGGSS